MANSLPQPLPRVRLPLSHPFTHSPPLPPATEHRSLVAPPQLPSWCLSQGGPRARLAWSSHFRNESPPVPGDSRWHRPQSLAEPLAQPRAAPVVCPFLSTGTAALGPSSASPTLWARGSGDSPRGRQSLLGGAHSRDTGNTVPRNESWRVRFPFLLDSGLIDRCFQVPTAPSVCPPLPRRSGPGGLPGAPSRWWWVWRTGLAPGPGWAGRRAGIPGMQLRLPGPGPTCSGLQIPSPPRPGLSPPGWRGVPTRSRAGRSQLRRQPVPRRNQRSERRAVSRAVRGVGGGY